MAKIPWNESMWFSPCYVIRELEREVVSGTDVMDRKLQKLREAWVCAVALISYSKLNPLEWWMQIPKDDPPDVLAMWLTPYPAKGQTISYSQFEVFEISEFDKEPIEISIIRKLGNKDYSNMIMVGYVRRSGFYDFDHIAREIRKTSPKVVAMFLVIFEQKLPHCTLVELLPDTFKIREDYKNYCKNSEQRDFITLKRGMTNHRDDSLTNDTFTIIP